MSFLIRHAPEFDIAASRFPGLETVRNITVFEWLVQVLLVPRTWLGEARATLLNFRASLSPSSGSTAFDAAETWLQSGNFEECHRVLCVSVAPAASLVAGQQGGQAAMAEPAAAVLSMLSCLEKEAGASLRHVWKPDMPNFNNTGLVVGGGVFLEYLRLVRDMSARYDAAKPPTQGQKELVSRIETLSIQVARCSRELNQLMAKNVVVCQSLLERGNIAIPHTANVHHERLLVCLREISSKLDGWAAFLLAFAAPESLHHPSTTVEVPAVHVQ